MKYLLVLIPYLLALFIIATLLKDNIKLSLKLQEKEETIESLNNNIDTLNKELHEKQYLKITNQDFEGVPI